jgi:glycolate oxidase iron-sulfur subunit
MKQQPCGPCANNVDAIHPLLTQIDAVISTASGCGVTLKDYGRLLAADPDYAKTGAEVAAATVDVSEYLTGLGHSLKAKFPGKRVAWHSPLQFAAWPAVRRRSGGLVDRCRL